MNIALFDSRDEASGFHELLAEVAGVESVVVPAGDAFAVDVLRPADFRAGIVYVLYYVKGFSLDDLPRQSHDERVAIICQHLVHYAVGERKWGPPPDGLRWYAERAQLDDAAMARAVHEGEQAFREPPRKGRWFGSKS